MAGLFEIQTCFGNVSVVIGLIRRFRYQSICAIHIPASFRTRVPVESYVRRHDEAPGAI